VWCRPGRRPLPAGAAPSPRTAALPAAALPAWLAVTVVGTVAGVLGYLFHGRAVVRGGRWHAAPA
jgi:hypothetical protein